MTYQQIKSFINTYIVQNGVNAITGAQLNTILNELADYKGFDSVVVTTLPAGSDATATVQGMTLVLGIPKGADGRDGQDAVNPFKGWFTTDNIPSTGQAGDYCHVSDTSTTPPTVTIYRWDTTTNQFKDTGEVPDTAMGETFASGETLQQVAIDDSHLVNPVNPADSTKPVLAKAEDAVQLKAKLGGVSAEIEKLADYTPVQGKYDAYGNEATTAFWYRTEVPIPEGTRNIRFLGVKLRYGLNDEGKNVGYAVGHYEEGVFVVDYRRRFEVNTDENVNIVKEYSIDITSPNNELYFRTEVQYGVTLNESNFYCYFTKGETVGDMVKVLSNKPLISRIKMLPAVKELGLSLIALGQRFVSSETTRTWFAFLKAGERIIVSNSFSISTYVCIGTASVDEPPHIVESGGSMDAFPKLESGNVVGEYSYEFTAQENCYFWITYRFAQGDPTFTKICNFEEKKPSLLLGAPSLHWSEFTGTDENISGKSVADVYAIYDELVSNHPLWIKKVDDIGYATLDSNLGIRHYVLGYQKATLQSTYAGENILYDDNGVNHDMPHIVISAGIHGDEKASVWGVAKACKEIIESNEPWAVYIKSNFVVDIIPIVSPYSFNSNSRNMTVGGVSIDPNRDYSTFALNESKAMRDFMLQTKAVCFIDCHNTKNSDTKERMFLSTPEGSMNAETANHLCMRLCSLMSMLIPASYPYPVDPKVYFLLSKATIAKTTTLAYFIGEMNGIMAFTMESPRNTNYDNPTNDCTLKASVLMTTLIENVIPALSELSV